MRVTDLLAPDARWNERDLPVGIMEPTHRLVPECEFTHGHDAIELAEIAGYTLMAFQRQGLIDKLGAVHVELRDGSKVERWAAQETADIVARRNGKSYEVECLVLAGLFILGERQIMYTAHRDDTAKGIFDSLRAAISRTPALFAEVADFRIANGQRAIILKNGAVCYFRTRTNDSARGQGFERLILDESQHLTEAQMASVMPVVTGAVNAQINYAGSPGDLVSKVQAKVWRSFEKQERGLCYRGWHADPDADFDDLDLVAKTNPRLGRGLSYEWIAKEFGRMTRAQFGRERCGASTYPRTEGSAWVIPEPAWREALDENSALAAGAKARFVLEADPELLVGTVAVAGRRTDSAMHIEVVQHQDGVGWMVTEAARLVREHDAELWLDPKGPCGFMLGDLRERGVPVRLFRPEDLTAAWSWLYTAAVPSRGVQDPEAPTPPPTVFHRGGQLLTQALAAAETRKLLDRQTLRRSVSGDVNQGPIVGAMLAGYAVVKGEKAKPPPPPSRPTRDSGDRTRANRRRPNPTADLSTANF